MKIKIYINIVEPQNLKLKDICSSVGEVQFTYPTVFGEFGKWKVSSPLSGSFCDIENSRIDFDENNRLFYDLYANHTISYLEIYADNNGEELFPAWVEKILNRVREYNAEISFEFFSEKVPVDGMTFLKTIGEVYFKCSDNPSIKGKWVVHLNALDEIFSIEVEGTKKGLLQSESNKHNFIVLIGNNRLSYIDSLNEGIPEYAQIFFKGLLEYEKNYIEQKSA